LKTQHCRIGRNPANDLVINDRAAEDFHSVISLNEDNLIFIEDLSSRYGTMVNGDRVSKTQLFPGDIVQIGFSRIDWESITDLKTSLSEIEVIPNMSVPVKRSILISKTISDETGKEEMSPAISGNASKSLADDVMETTALLDRIEKDFNTIPSLPNEPDSLEIDNNQSIEVSNSLHNEEQAEIPQQNEVSSVDIQASIIPNVVDQTIETESSKADLNKDKENPIEKDLFVHSEHVSLEEVIEEHKSESQWPNIDKEVNTEIFINTQSTESIPEEIIAKNESLNQQKDAINENKIIPSSESRNRVSQDTFHIIIAITITALLLCAGWLIGQVS
jgi:hypothetical protein